MDEFSKQKIIYPNMTKFLPFYYDTNSYFTNQKCIIITGENIAYLTAFMNSSLFKFCFRDNFPELQGGTRELSKIFFDKIPVIKIDSATNASFEDIVVKIQARKSQNEDTDDLDRLLDDMIFNLYEIEPSERSSIISKAHAL